MYVCGTVVNTTDSIASYALHERKLTLNHSDMYQIPRTETIHTTRSSISIISTQYEGDICFHRDSIYCQRIFSSPFTYPLFSAQ